MNSFKPETKNRINSKLKSKDSFLVRFVSDLNKKRKPFQIQEEEDEKK